MHIIYAVYSTSFVVPKDEHVIGGHEQFSKDVAQRKYPMKLERDGYCVPDEGQWKIYETRIKKEVLADFAADLCAINLNPTDNKISLWKVFRANKGKSEVEQRIPHKQLLFIQWIMKWLNRFGLSPFKPCPVSNKTPNIFAPKAWRSVVILGCRDDPTEQTKYSGPHPDTL